jgi:hypothetical protein
MSSKVMVIISTAEKDKALGFNVEYVGAFISDSIKAGYIPMVF